MPGLNRPPQWDIKSRAQEMKSPMSQSAGPHGGDPFRTDVVVIGAGPAGLFAVFECGMLGLRCHVVDTLEAIGGQCIALYPEKPIFDIPAYPRIAAADLIDRLAEQAAPFDPVYHLGQQVVGLTRTGGGFLVRTSLGAAIACAAVIIAGGAGAFGPNRPPLDGLECYENRSIFYLVKKRQDFAGKRVVIAGGGDSAVDWAVSLAEIAAHVMVVHRRDKFRAAPESVRAMRRLAAEGRVEMVVPYQLSGLEGADGRLTGVRVETLDGEQRLLEADRLLPFFGLAMELGPIAEWGLDLDGAHIAVDPATAATTIPGVFAIGDIAAYPGKLKLILTGFAEAAVAAHAAFAVARPGEALHFQYSTSKGVPASPDAEAAA
jgi:thioredoxin reductase (NADPH)